MGIVLSPGVLEDDMDQMTYAAYLYRHGVTGAGKTEMLEYFIYHYGTQIIAAILCAIFGCLGYAIKQLAVKYINDDTKRSIAREAMMFVEQVWKTIHGADKLSKALEVAEALLKKKGIDFDAEEMQILIEAAVAEFNKTFKSTPLTEESTADAARRVVSE